MEVPASTPTNRSVQGGVGSLGGDLPLPHTTKPYAAIDTLDEKGYIALLRAICPDSLRGNKCSGGKRPDHSASFMHVCLDWAYGVRLSIETWLYDITNTAQKCKQETILHDGKVHVLRSCFSLTKKQECKRGGASRGCPEGHGHEQIRMDVEDARRERARQNYNFFNAV